MILNIPVQLRRGTLEEWTDAATVLAAGEAGYATDTHELKIGDGETSFADLAPINAGGAEVVGEWNALLPGTPTNEAFNDPGEGFPAALRWRFRRNGTAVEFGGFAQYLDLAGDPATPDPFTLVCTLPEEARPVDVPVATGTWGDTDPPFDSAVAGVAVQPDGPVLVVGTPTSPNLAITYLTWDVAVEA